jgi:hypothetical protein
MKTIIIVMTTVVAAILCTPCRACPATEWGVDVDATAPICVDGVPRYVGGNIIVYDWSVEWYVDTCEAQSRQQNADGSWGEWSELSSVKDSANYSWTPGPCTAQTYTRTGTVSGNNFVSATCTAHYGTPQATNADQENVAVYCDWTDWF